MTLYYSASTTGFYDDGLNINIPSDSVVITQEEHTALLSSQSEGRVICVGPDGRPTTKLPDRQPLDEYKRTAKDKINDLRTAEEQKGFSYLFPDGVQDVVQLRDTRDLINMSSMVTSARILKDSGYTGTLPFQALSNNTHKMTPDEMVAMGLACSSYIQSLYAKAWPIKAEIDEAGDYDAVDALVVWPE